MSEDAPALEDVASDEEALPEEEIAPEETAPDDEPIVKPARRMCYEVSLAPDCPLPMVRSAGTTIARASPLRIERDDPRLAEFQGMALLKVTRRYEAVE